MLSVLAAGLLAATSPVHDGPVSIECRLIGADGEQLRPPMRLYTGRHDARFSVANKVFLDMRYNAWGQTVAVTVVSAPSAPWTFGETVIAPERMFGVGSGKGPAGTIDLPAVGPGVTLRCGQMK